MCSKVAEENSGMLKVWKIWWKIFCYFTYSTSEFVENSSLVSDTKSILWGYNGKINN